MRSKNSPAVPEAAAIWNVLLDEGVDPSFALAQYRVESQYGTSGWAAITKSWGNMLWDENLTIHAVGPYKASNGYTYAKYINLEDAIRDYCRYIHWYIDRHNLITIYGATGRWLGINATGTAGHLSYVTIVVNDMISYEFTEGEFYETGDKMVHADKFTLTDGRLRSKYPLAPGTELYRGTDGSLIKKFSPFPAVTANAWFFGLVNGSTDWGVVFVKIGGTAPRGVYIKNIDPNKIINV